MIVISFVGVPECGKSTVAAYTYAKLKINGIRAELVQTSSIMGSDWQKHELQRSISLPIELAQFNTYDIPPEVVVLDGAIITPLLMIPTETYGTMYMSIEERKETKRSIDGYLRTIYDQYNNQLYFLGRPNVFNYNSMIGDRYTEPYRDSDGSLHSHIYQNLQIHELNFTPINADESQYEIVISNAISAVMGERSRDQNLAIH